MGARGRGHCGFLAVPVLTIAQACWGGGVRHQALHSPVAAELMLYETVPGLLPASAYLELWLLLLPGEAGVGSCCPISPSLRTGKE